VAETTIEKARAVLKAAQQVIILSHERPDGDAIGSLLALTLSLERAGEKCHPGSFGRCTVSFSLPAGRR